jgi:hypothetical protein
MAASRARRRASSATARVKVVCRAAGFEETLRLLAWAVGHPVSFEEARRPAITRCLYVETGLAYDGRSDVVLEDLGLDVVGKVDGVLSWTVVPASD